MTAQEHFERKKRRLGFLVYRSFGLGVVGILTGEFLKERWLSTLFGILFMLGVGAVIFSFHRRFVCPWCRGDCSGLFGGPNFFRFDRRFLYCPCCGHRLDEEVPASDADSASEPANVS